MSMEWALVSIEVVGVAVAIWQIKDGHKKTRESVIETIATAQAVTRAVGEERDKTHAKDMLALNEKLDKIEAGEGLCRQGFERRLALISTGENECRQRFEHRVTVVEGQAKSTQVELTELKGELKEGMR